MQAVCELRTADGRPILESCFYAQFTKLPELVEMLPSGHGLRDASVELGLRGSFGIEDDSQVLDLLTYLWLGAVYEFGCRGPVDTHKLCVWHR